MDYLIFQLYGPMASWGHPATGEIRRSATHPTRSAIIGLVACALGIERADTDSLAVLRDGLNLAVKQYSPGVLMTDYHTAQVPGRDKKAHRPTRRDELALPKHKLHTILSTREYRCDGYWRIALSANDSLSWSLTTVAEALKRPRFPLYLGRKSCPPAAPLAPRVVNAGGIREALSQSFEPLNPALGEHEKRYLGFTKQVAYAWEGDGGDITPQETRYPDDQPLNRTRWQFTTRAEHWATVTEEA